MNILLLDSIQLFGLEKKKYYLRINVMKKESKTIIDWILSKYIKEDHIDKTFVQI